MFKKLFARNKNTVEEIVSEAASTFLGDGIVCDDEEIREFIVNWANSRELNPKNFGDFLTLVGFQSPVTLHKLDNENHSISCFTADGSENCFFLNTNTSVDFSFIEGEETRHYMFFNHDEHMRPSIFLKGTCIKRNGKVLDSNYDYREFSRVLDIDDTHTLYVSIWVPQDFENYDETFGTKNRIEIENYLLSLDTSLSLYEVASKIFQLLSFTSYEISKFHVAEFSYKVDNNIVHKLLFKDGSIIDSIGIDAQEIFHIYQKGDWEYSSNDFDISYFTGKNRFKFVLIGNEEYITNVDVNETLTRVKRKISDLWDTFRK